MNKQLIKFAAIFTLIIAVFLLMAVKTAEPAPQKLTIELDNETFHRTFTVDYQLSKTAGDLLKEVAKALGVHSDYVVLYRSSECVPVVDQFYRNTDRSFSLRIGTSSNHSLAAMMNAKTLDDLDIKANDHILALLRPIKGDHIHYALAIYIEGELVDVVYDRPVVSTIYEGDCFSIPNNCGPDAKKDDHFNYHILTTFPHTGFHSGHSHWFGFGLTHSHPATAAQWFRYTEGLGANLDAFLEQVGVYIWEVHSRRYPYHTPLGAAQEGEVILDFPLYNDNKVLKVGGSYSGDGTRNKGGRSIAEFANMLPYSKKIYPTDSRVLIKNTNEKVWRLYYYSYYKNVEPLILEQGIGRVWLHENLGLLVLSYEDRELSPDHVPPKPPEKQIEYLFNSGIDKGKAEFANDFSQYYTLGFDGSYYPMPNAPLPNYDKPKVIPN